MTDGGRIRFHSLDLKRADQPGHVTCQVTLAWHPDHRATGSADGVDSEIGRIRAAATAAARALERAVNDRVHLEVLGTRTIQAFDAVIVVVLLAGRFSDHTQRVVGSSLITGRPVHAAVRAVLSATNRLLGESTIFLR